MNLRPVWITLYLLMGIAFYLILESGSKLRTIAIWIFMLQLLLNALWSPIFFDLQAPLAGLVWIFILWLAITGLLLYSTGLTTEQYIFFCHV